MEDLTLVIYTFTVIIGLAIIGFSLMMIVAFWAAKPKEPMAFSRLVADGNGLRIVTVIAIIMGVVYLGFADIIDQSTISPILSGIAGYVLGGWAISRNIIKDKSGKSA